MTRFVDILVSAALVLTGVVLFSMTFGEEFDVPTFGGDVGPAFAPQLFLAVWILLACIALTQALRSTAEPALDIRWGQLLWIVIIATTTAYAMTKIGFVFATIPGFALFCWAFQFRRPLPLLILSVTAPLGIWALFTFGFELLLPHSPWFHRI
ncbi:MAG: tripartite tricarboxylate transporter TctB family protein [Stappiaceae bacterium]